MVKKTESSCTASETDLSGTKSLKNDHMLGLRDLGVEMMVGVVNLWQH